MIIEHFYIVKLSYGPAHQEKEKVTFSIYIHLSKRCQMVRLINWYKKFPNQAKEDGIITVYCSLLKEVENQEFKTLAQFPYFDGNSLSKVFDVAMKEWEEEQEEQKSKGKKKKYETPFCKNQGGY